MFTTVEGFYNDTIKIDSNGNFEFTAKVAKPQFAYFSIKEKQASLVLFVENGVNCHADITFQPAQMDGIEYNKAILNRMGYMVRTLLHGDSFRGKTRGTLQG